MLYRWSMGWMTIPLIFNNSPSSTWAVIFLDFALGSVYLRTILW